MAFTAGYKVNEGTQYEFTVSNETIEEMVQAEGGITDADITPYCFTAFFDSRIDALVAMPEPPYYESGSASSWMSEYCASLVDPSANLPNHVYYNADIVPYNATKVYQRNFLTWYGEIYPGTENARWGNFLVMDIKNIKNWYMNFDEGNNFVQGSVESSSICPGYTGAVWSYISNSIHHFGLHSNNNDPLQHPDENLWVRNILVIGEDVWIGNMNPSNYGSQNLSTTYSRNPNVYQGPHVGAPVYNNGDTSDWPKMFQKGQHSWLAYPTFPNPELPDSNTVATETGNVSTGMVDYEVCTNDMVIQNNFHYADDYWGADKTDTQVVADTVCTQLSTVLKMQAWCGLMFHFQDKYYKPIVSGGVITGYTDDMTQESDWDDITNVTGNNISPTPPGPAPGPGDDDPWDGVDFSGSSGGGGAFAKFYYMTSTELANLRSWMNSNNVPEGFNPMAQIIGLSQLPVAISGSDSENVMFVNSSAIYSEHQNRVVDTGVATQRGLGRTIIFNLGSVEIPRRMQQRGEPYLDYSCAVELYLPFCGVFSLDTQAVMGRTITAQLVLDPTSGSVIAYAWVSESGQKLPVAYGSGQVGVDLPVTAQQYSMSKAALTQANSQLYSSILNSAMATIQAIGGNAAGMNSAYSSAASKSAKFGGSAAQQATAGTNAARGAMSMPSDYVQYNTTNNAMSGFLNWGRAVKEVSYGNNTAVSGSFGGSYASWSNPFTAYVKIIRPKFQKPSNYNHTQAVPCVEAKTVGSCTGLIQCIGVDASGITNATSGERDQIVAALSNGVYAGR